MQRMLFDAISLCAIVLIGLPLTACILPLYGIMVFHTGSKDVKIFIGTQAVTT